MKKINLNNIEEARTFNRPEAGPYICVITDVTDHPQEEYLEIEYDIAEGDLKGYYTGMRERGFDWAGKYRQYYSKGAQPFFKAFCTAVSRSNGNFVFDANEVNCEEKTLVGKKIGLNFGEEKYDGNDGNVKTALRVRRSFSIDKLDSQTVPPLVDKTRKAPVTANIDVFVPADVDEELPFK